MKQPSVIIPALIVLLIIIAFAFGVFVLEYERTDSQTVDQAESFCVEWLEDVECGGWAVEIVKQHGDSLETCFNRYAVDDVEVYGCVLDEVFN